MHNIFIFLPRLVYLMFSFPSKKRENIVLIFSTPGASIKACLTKQLGFEAWMTSKDEIHLDISFSSSTVRAYVGTKDKTLGGWKCINWEVIMSY